MIIRVQTSQMFVTDSGPFSDSSCKFHYRLKNVRAPSPCQIQVFQDNLTAYFCQFSLRFQFFFWTDGLQDMMYTNFSNTRLFYFSIRSIVQRIFLHDISDHKITRLLSSSKIRDSNIFFNSSIMFSFDLHSRWVHLKYTWSRKENESQDQSMSSIHFT